MVVFLQLPVLVVVLASFSRTSYLTVPPQGLTLRWFAAVLGDAEYLAACLDEPVLAVAATIGSLVLGLAASYALIRRQVPGAAALPSLPTRRSSFRPSCSAWRCCSSTR